MKRISYIVPAVLLLAAVPLSCKEQPDIPGTQKHEYACSYPVRCNLFTTTKADMTENNDGTFSYTWSADDSIYVVDPLTGAEVGTMEFVSGEGQGSALFLLKTDLGEGSQVSLRLWNNAESLPSTQVSSYGVSHPNNAWACTGAFTLNSRMNECSFTNPLAYIRVRLGTFEGSALHESIPESVSLTTDRTWTAMLSGYPGLNSETTEAWIAVPPADMSQESIDVMLKCGSSGASCTLDGRNLEAGHVYTINLTAAGGGVRPADNSKSEYTYTSVQYKQSMESSSYGNASNITVSGMNRMPMLLSNTLDRWGGYAGVKPDSIMSSNPAGYWRTGKYKGRWVMVNPDGNVTILHGVNGAAPTPAKGEATETSLALYNERFASSAQWSLYANKLLSDYGFNFYSANPQRIRNYRSHITKSDQALMHHSTGNAQIGETAIVYLLRTFLWDYSSISKTSLDVNDSAKGGSVFTLMFDPDYPEYIDSLAADAAALFKDDINFIGYYLDNELQFRWTSSTTPGIWLSQWLQLYTGDGCTRAFPYAKAYAENFMRERYGVEPVPANVTSEMENAFLLDISERYYQTATEAMRRHDPNHLMAGTRLHGKPKTLKQVTEACAKYNDIVSVNIYGVWEPDDGYFISQYKTWVGEYEKPCMVTEFYTRDADATFDGAKYGNTGEGGGWIVRGQEARGIHYQNFTRKLISYDHCVGWQWFQMTDVHMNDYGWNNKGILNPQFVPYYPLMDKMRELHWNIYQIMDWYFDRGAMISSLPSNSSEAYWED